MSAPHLHSSRGFTLVELMVTIAMAAILIGIGIPAFNELVRQRAMTTRVNDLVLAITYARSEAIRQGRLVSVQAMDPSDDDNQWGPGYCVVVGNPGGCAAPVLRMFPGFDDATLNGEAGFAGVTTLSFNARGLLVFPAAAGPIRLCSNNPAVDPGRQVNVNRTGRVDVVEFECNDP